MPTDEVKTADLIKVVGSPFTTQNSSYPDEFLLRIYDRAFFDRVAPLYLHMHRRTDWDPKLERHYRFVVEREAKTRSVLSGLAKQLNDWDSHDSLGYVIFKSLKPYPAIPNDTDVLIFGGKKEFESALKHLYAQNYVFHEWAPMQTTIYDPRGRGKIGAGKKGGTYYIDVYREISTDYVCYLGENAIHPHVIVCYINGVPVRLLRQEPELAIILFHNVFPERTYQLEHFYMPLYCFADPSFDLNLFMHFAEANGLTRAIRTNLSFAEVLHKQHFGFVPQPIERVLDKWGRSQMETERFIQMGMESPYLFSTWLFWKAATEKVKDTVFLKSLLVQGMHMMNPLFFLDVVVSLKRRFSERGVYHME